MIYEKELKLTLSIAAKNAESEEVINGALALFERRIKNIKFSTPSCVVKVVEINPSRSRRESDRQAVRRFIERIK
jgi:hypothetical protein